MVNFEEEGTLTAKIIDLGLAKAVSQPGSQTTISTIGHFAGTPEYASPEQFGESRSTSAQIFTRSECCSGRCLPATRSSEARLLS